MIDPTVEKELTAVAALTDEEALEAARNDPDNPPIDEVAWRAARAREAECDRHGVARLRRKLGMAQVVFASRYRIPLSTPRQWEQGVLERDRAAKSLLAVIEADPVFAADAIRRHAHAA